MAAPTFHPSLSYKQLEFQAKKCIYLSSVEIAYFEFLYFIYDRDNEDGTKIFVLQIPNPPSNYSILDVIRMHLGQLQNDYSGMISIS